MENVVKKRLKGLRKTPTDKAISVKEDLKEQLIAIGKFGKHYEDLIDDYIYYLDLKDELIKDIRKYGLRINTPTGNGHEALKPNESISNLMKVTAQMLKLLGDLNLQEPVGEVKPPSAEEESNKNDYLPANK